MKNVSVSILLGLFLSTSVLAENTPGQELLSYFSANCRTQGEYTSAALADSKALINTLQSIAQDPDCRSVGGAVSQLGLLNQQLEKLAQVNATQTKIAELNAQEQELLIQLTATSDATALAEINSNLRLLQVTRAGLIGKEKANQDLMGPDKSMAMSNVIQIANASFSQLVGNQKCLQKNPSVLNTATSVLAAVGATAATVNPALGMGITAGASFLGETIEGIRRMSSSRAIRKIADSTIAFEAYKCALETMSERWCQMRDAETFLAFKAAQRRRPIVNTNLGTAIRLNDREIPVLLEWLGKIRAGVTPTTAADASSQSTIFFREAMVRSALSSGVGLIEENRQIYNSYTNLDERWIFLRSIILQLTKHNPEMRSPLFDVMPPGYSPYFLIGVADDGGIRNDLGYIDFSTWQKPAGLNPTLDQVKEKYLEWVNSARVRVNQELSRVLQPDPLQTISGAFDRTENRWKISPFDSLVAIIKFLELTGPQEHDLAFRRLYADTLKKLKAIKEITETSVINNIVDISPVEQIYELAQLKYGTVVVQTRLDMIVRLSLLELLDNSSEADQIVVAQLLAAERFTETIAKMSGTDNLALIRADIKRAQPITIANLASFMDVFGNNVNRILAKLKNEEQWADKTVASAKRYARTEMCFLLLSVPDAADYVDTRLCDGLKFEAVVAGGPETTVLSRSTFQKDLNDRACEYREFFRKSKIYETWGVK